MKHRIIFPLLIGAVGVSLAAITWNEAQKIDRMADIVARWSAGIEG